MVNNVGKTTKSLNSNLGGTTSFTSDETITTFSGDLGLGYLLFDSKGTIGVISAFTNKENFIVTTYALSVDIKTILSLSY